MVSKCDNDNGVAGELFSVSVVQCAAKVAWQSESAYVKCKWWRGVMMVVQCESGAVCRLWVSLYHYIVAYTHFGNSRSRRALTSGPVKYEAGFIVKKPTKGFVSICV